MDLLIYTIFVSILQTLTDLINWVINKVSQRSTHKRKEAEKELKQLTKEFEQCLADAIRSGNFDLKFKFPKHTHPEPKPDPKVEEALDRWYGKK